MVTLRALDRKLVRDLLRLKAQVLTIALVAACGIASFIAARGTFRSLTESRDQYYARYRFADVFVHLERAPEQVADKLLAIAGVATLHTRVVENVTVPIAGLPEPALGRIVSLPPRGDEPPINALYLRSGRFPDPERSDEAVVLEAFALARGIEPGDRVPLVINGTYREVRIVGVALSPEFVFAISEIDPVADPARFGVFFMPRDAIAAAFDMDGAFNDVVFRLEPGASRDSVLGAVDRVLEPYGGTSAIARDKQLSNNVLTGEIDQLRALALFVPIIFLAVAALLVNVVLVRLVALDRPQIATLKAIGYGNGRVALHYLQLVVVIMLLGAAIGTAFGFWVGGKWTGLYTQYFRFPVFGFRLDPSTAAIAILVSLGVASVGAFGVVLRVAGLPPAEAMQPPSPPNYRLSTIEKTRVVSLVGPAARMILRELSRRPLRAVMSSLGIAMAIGIVVVGRYMQDAVEYWIAVQFSMAQREDMNVVFRKPEPLRAVREIAHLPGVLAAQGMHAVPVRFRAGQRWRTSLLIGYEQSPRILRNVVDEAGNVVPLADDGLIMTEKLGEILHLAPGDEVEVEVLEGKPRRFSLPIARFASELAGLAAHAPLDWMSQKLGEEPVVSSALVAVDPEKEADLERALGDIPKFVGSARKLRVIEQFRKQTAQSMDLFSNILSAFAIVIAVGIVYNNARVALSTRGHELATLRVLGMTRGEISAILLGEIAVEVLLALPFGMGFGRLFSAGIAAIQDSEQFRFPLVISDRTYVLSIVVVLAAALVSGLVVRRRLDHLDLIGVLKARE